MKEWEIYLWSASGISILAIIAMTLHSVFMELVKIRFTIAAYFLERLREEKEHQDENQNLA